MQRQQVNEITKGIIKLSKSFIGRSSINIPAEARIKESAQYEK